MESENRNTRRPDGEQLQESGKTANKRIDRGWRETETDRGRHRDRL